MVEPEPVSSNLVVAHRFAQEVINQWGVITTESEFIQVFHCVLQRPLRFKFFVPAYPPASH